MLPSSSAAAVSLASEETEEFCRDEGGEVDSEEDCVEETPRVDKSGGGRESGEDPGGSQQVRRSAASNDRSTTKGHKGKGKGKPRGGKGAGEKKSLCKGCWKQFPPKDMPVGCDFCWADKRALDNIYRQVRAQGEYQWWQEHRHNDEKCHT